MNRLHRSPSARTFSLSFLSFSLPFNLSCILSFTLLFSPALSAEAEEDKPDQAAALMAELAATPYTIAYEARYRGFRASGEGTLEVLDEDHYRMRTLIDLQFFGQSVTSIDEQSDFRIKDETVLPEHYHFEQSGIGSRFHQQSFDHAAGEVLVQHNDGETAVDIPGNMLLDELSAIFYLRSRLALGEEDISFPVLDGSRVETHRYQVAETTSVDNDLGSFEALRVERIRAPDSQRSTTMWFAPQHGFVLLRLVQTDPEDRTLELIMTDATLDGEPIGGESI